MARCSFSRCVSPRQVPTNPALIGGCPSVKRPLTAPIRRNPGCRYSASLHYALTGGPEQGSSRGGRTARPGVSTGDGGLSARLRLPAVVLRLTTQTRRWFGSRGVAANCASSTAIALDCAPASVARSATQISVFLAPANLVFHFLQARSSSPIAHKTILMCPETLCC